MEPEKSKWRHGPTKRSHERGGKMHRAKVVGSLALGGATLKLGLGDPLV